MIGSLVLVYPTKHEGGALALRHGGEEWVFDSGKILSSAGQPSIAYVAFFSDVEHEVLPVQKGYRVTITYNLYIDGDDGATVTHGNAIIDDLENAAQERISLIKDTICTQLDNAQFYPEGGILAFALYHEYPVAKKGVAAISASYLKGRDAILYAACKELGLHTRTTFWYRDTRAGYDFQFLGDKLKLDDAVYDNDTDIIYDAKRAKAKLVSHAYDEPEYLEEADRDLKPFLWATDPQKRNRVEEKYISYGNEPQLSYIYGEGCLVVEIGGPGDRIVLQSSN